MAKFYVGQKIKKVRGNYIGTEGRVHDFSPIIHGFDMRVALEDGTPCEFSDGEPAVAENGDLINTKSQEWEPITPPHEACDPEFAESIRYLTDSVSA